MGFDYDIRVQTIVIVGRIIEKRFKTDRAVAVCRVMLLVSARTRGDRERVYLRPNLLERGWPIVHFTI
jgi:hypothetical protein